MKRTNISDELLKQIVGLRQAGNSWLKIEELTNPKVGRRVAQRAYERWERARSTRELESARWEVGKAEFERHLDALAWWAENILDLLSIPELPDIDNDAKTHFNNLMERDIPGYLVSGVLGSKPKSDPARNRRRNELLDRSLREHTQGTIRWEAIEEWMESRDNCNRLLTELQVQFDEILRDTLGKIPGLEERFILTRGLGNPMERLADEMMKALWKAILVEDVNVATDLLSDKTISHRDREVTLVTIGEKNVLQLDEDGMDRAFVDICRDTIGKTWDTEVCREMVAGIRQIREIGQELATVLEPLSLRPLVLKSRCFLCPL